MTVSCTHAVQEKCSSWELRGSAQFSWCTVAACGLLCRLDWRLGERVWWEDRRICALVELRQKFYCVNAHGAQILTSNTRILKVQGARASVLEWRTAVQIGASLLNKVCVQQLPLAIHQRGITGTVINHRNKVLIAIWPECPHDMICRILLPPKLQRLSERLLGCMNGEQVKRAAPRPRWRQRGVGPHTSARPRWL